MDRKIDKAKVDAILLQLEHLRVDHNDLDFQDDYDSIEGGYGNVSVAKLDEELVAVKTLRLHGSGEDRTRLACRLARELNVWAPFKHPNVLRLRGFAFSHDLCIGQLIAPLQIHGHIGDYLKDRVPSETERLGLASDTAHGLQYLHDNFICHGDLKPSNILVDENRTAVLCDFGLAKAISEATSGLTTTKSIRGSVRYFSPELMKDEEDAPSQTLSSDIWAWACVALEILTDIPPHASIPSSREHAVYGRLIRGVLPAELVGIVVSSAIKTLLGDCWALEPSARPQIVDCASTLQRESHALSTVHRSDGSSSMAPERSTPSRDGLNLSLLSLKTQPKETSAFWYNAAKNAIENGNAPSPPPGIQELDSSFDTNNAASDIPYDIDTPIALQHPVDRSTASSGIPPQHDSPDLPTSTFQPSYQRLENSPTLVRRQKEPVWHIGRGRPQAHATLVESPQVESPSQGPVHWAGEYGRFLSRTATPVDHTRIHDPSPVRPSGMPSTATRSDSPLQWE